MIKYFFYLLLVMSLSACYSSRKLVYLQDKHFSEQDPTFVENTKGTYRIQPNDVLSVKVKSATDADVSDIFNISPSEGINYLAPGSLYLEGYSVNTQGQIVLPVLGALTVKDLTVEEAQTLIQTQAGRYLNNATVIVKLISFKVTVLGEVRNPGYHYVFNNQATILEGLGLAGDLTPEGSRRKVKLIRQEATGTAVVLLDLTDPKLLESEYYFLKPNDVIYVEPLKAKLRRTNLDLLGLIFSGATTAILILNYINGQ